MILKRKDNTFVIDGEFGPYHVIEEDPIYQDVLDRLNSGEQWEWDISPSPGEGYEWNETTWQWEESLVLVKTRLNKACDKHLESVILQSGFPWGEHTIRCDAVSQQNATGFMTAIAAGINPFPIVWRTIENVNISFSDVTEFQPFAEAMMGFINQKFQEKWSAKDTIAAAETEEEANQIYQDYIGG